MIRKVKWKNYKALGNLELDFTKEDGSVYNTIVLAGENGTGKTTILDTLSVYLNRGSVLPFEFIEYDIDGSIYRMLPPTNYGEFGFHKRVDMVSGKEETINSGMNNNSILIENDATDLRHYGFAYSRARSGFRTAQVKASTTQQIDVEKYEPDSSEDFTRIKQMLVDIDAQDSSTWRKLSENGNLSDQKYIDFKKQSKSCRFETAFNNFFESVKYIGIDNENPDEKRVVFSKHGNQISVDDLSTGEKQIVFRGAHLLRNINSISRGIVLIDEPELSMHPIWQKKALDYYRGLFTSGGDQSVQIIVATHSEYVIQSALEDRENVLVIVLSDESGVINSRLITAPNALSIITSAETNYLAFGILSTDYHIELYGWLQTKTGNTKIEDCDRYISQQSQYDPVKHEKIDSYQNHHYQTLPTFIRNAIDHPDSRRLYTKEEFDLSIKLLRELCM